jgi:hypothetical protein
MQSQEDSTESSLPITLTPSNPVSTQPLESQKTSFSPDGPTKDGELTMHEYRERMLQSRAERVKKHPVKEEYWRELQKREKTLKRTRVLLQELADEENRSKGLSSKSRSDYVSKRRRLRYSKRRRSRLKLTQEAGTSEESSKEVGDATRMLQRCTSSATEDERTRPGSAERARSSYGTEAHRVVVERFTLSDPSLRREK